MASQQSPPKKPRLSLQIKTAIAPARAPRGFSVDPKDPTTFNTLSNAYVTAIERSTPLTAINTLQSFSISTPSEYKDSKQRVQTPYVANYPETPLTAHADSPVQPMEVNFPSTMTATPPLSGGPTDPNSKVFTFSAIDTAVRSASQIASPIEARTPRRRAAPYKLAGLGIQAPYAHPRSLHSILRNSPLPPQTAIIPPSPRRQSLRLREKAEKKVEYNSPLTQDIITNTYTKSHIDLLVEEASPNSPPVVFTPQQVEEVDIAKAFAPNEIQDGGMTPGPDSDLGSRMAALSPASASGIRKRKRKEKKRRWVWTIGQEDEEGIAEQEVGGAIAAVRAQAKTEDDARTPVPRINYIMPTPSIESASASASANSASDIDTDMSDVSSVFSEEERFVPRDMELDLKTPTAPKMLLANPQLAIKRDSPIPELGVTDGKGTPIPDSMPNRDTPVPPELCG